MTSLYFCVLIGSLIATFAPIGHLIVTTWFLQHLIILTWSSACCTSIVLHNYYFSSDPGPPHWAFWVLFTSHETIRSILTPLNCRGSMPVYVGSLPSLTIFLALLTISHNLCRIWGSTVRGSCQHLAGFLCMKQLQILILLPGWNGSLPQVILHPSLGSWTGKLFNLIPAFYWLGTMSAMVGRERAERHLRILYKNTLHQLQTGLKPIIIFKSKSHTKH